MVRLDMRCATSLESGRPVTRYGPQLAILSLIGTKKMELGHLECLTVTNMLEMEGAWTRGHLGESQQLSLQPTSAHGKGH